MKVHNKQELYERRKELRTNATSQEVKLWTYLRGKKLRVRFRRQQSVGWYILDFYCPEKKLAIEIDGDEHKKNREYDDERTEYLKTRGIKILRFWNGEVERDIEIIVAKIKVFLSCP